MDVNQSGDDQLAASIDHVGGIRCDVGFDGGNTAIGNGDVTNGIELAEWIDDMSAFYDQIVFRRRRQHVWKAGKRRNTCGCPDKLPPANHVEIPPNLQERGRKYTPC